MTSPLALTVEEVRACYFDPDADGIHWFSRMTDNLNTLIESKRQSYMSTDRARAEYDDDLKVST